MTQTRTPSRDTHDERPRRSHSGTLGWDTNKRLMAGHVRERGSDHVNVPTAPGAGHEEPVFPWSHADFRNHVLRLVREYVPAIIEELHTIADRSDLVLSPRGLLESQIWPDIDACATRWQLEKPWITRTLHRTVRWWHLSPAMRDHRQWAPVLPEYGWGSRRSWRRRKAIQYRGPREQGPRRHLGVEGVGLAGGAACTAVAPIHFHDMMPGSVDGPCQASAVAPGAFDPERLNPPVCLGPRDQSLVATRVRHERVIAQTDPPAVDCHRDVDMRMRINTDDHRPRFGRRSYAVGHGLASSDCGPELVRVGGQDCDGPWVQQAPIGSRPSGQLAAGRVASGR